MIKVKDLIATLQARNPEALVYLMTQRRQPFENRLAGVVTRAEMLDQYWRIEPGVAADDVFLVVGKQLRPGSLSAWIVAEHGAAVPGFPFGVLPPLAGPEPHAPADAELPDETLAQIVREHLDMDGAVADLESRGLAVPSGELLAVCFGELRDALRSAYRAGRGSSGGEPPQAAPAHSSELAHDDVE